MPQISATTWCAVSVRDGINWTQVHLNAAENQALDALTMGGAGLVAVGWHDGRTVMSMRREYEITSRTYRGDFRAAR